MRKYVYSVELGFTNNGVGNDMPNWKSVRIVASNVALAMKKVRLRKHEWIASVQRGVEIDVC